MSLTKAGTIVRIDSRKGATMNLNLSDWDWLNAALGVLFLYRGIRDLYNGTGTGWSSDDEKKHFRKFYAARLNTVLCFCTFLWYTVEKDGRCISWSRSFRFPLCSTLC